MEKIKVLVIYNSPLVNNVLGKALKKNSEIELVGSATNSYLAARKVEELNPDILILDIRMANMDCLQYLERFMVHHSIPVIVVSTLTTQRNKLVLKALEMGVVDFLIKPPVTTKNKRNEFQTEVISKIKSVARANVVSKFKEDFISRELTVNKEKAILGIGASTGGFKAIKELLARFTAKMPGIIIVQHMPQEFTSAFVRRLNHISDLEVKEAENGDQILSGQALIIPGGYESGLNKSDGNYYLWLKNNNQSFNQQSSIDTFFTSLAVEVKDKAIGVLLTGMGNDGAEGLKQIKEAGGYTIVQDEETSALFEMPKQAIEQGAAKEVVSLDKIADGIIRVLNNQ